MKARKPLSFFLLVALMGCDQPSITDQMVGTWKMDKMFNSDQEVSAEHNPSNNRIVEFHADGTFRSDGDPYGENTGKWSVDEGTKELYLDSDLDEGDDSYWIVRLDGDRMFWQGTRFEFTKTFRVEHVRAATE